jgi:hypothetical protein
MRSPGFSYRVENLSVCGLATRAVTAIRMMMNNARRIIAAVRTRGEGTYFGSGAFIARLLSFGHSPAQDLAGQIEHDGAGIARRIADPMPAAGGTDRSPTPVPTHPLAM